MIPRIKIGAALGVNGMTLRLAVRKQGIRVGRRGGVAGSQGDIEACADEWRKYVDKNTDDQ